MNDIVLSETNFLEYAAKNYHTPGHLDIEEFKEDLSRFKYIKRLFNRYKKSGNLQERLLLNHIIVVYNVFGIPAATRMLFYKLQGHYMILKTFLEFLNLMPDEIYGIGEDKYLHSKNINSIEDVAERLRNL